MITYTQNTRTKQWDIVGLQTDIKVGQECLATKRNTGQEVKVTPTRVGKPFKALWGPHEGEMCVIASLRTKDKEEEV